jgi:hypothetical protein
MDGHYRINTDFEKELRNEHLEILKEYKAKGQIEGKTNFPDSSSTGLSPSELAIRARYSEFVSKFKAHSEQIISDLVGNYQHIGSDLNELHQKPEIITKAIESLKSNFNNKKEEERTIHQSNITKIYQNPNFTSSKINFQDLETKFRVISEKLDRTLPILPKLWYFPILFVMGVSEFYLTFSAFASNGGNVLETSIMALSAGIVFPILAHFSGKIMRQGKKNTNNLVSLIVMFSLALGLAYFLAKQIVESQITYGYITSPSQANTFLVMRILIVLGIFAAGLLISFFNHEPDLNFLDIFNLKEKERLNFQKHENIVNEQHNLESKRFQENNTQLKQKLQDDIDYQNNRIENLQKQFKESNKNLEKAKDYYTNTLITINSWYKITIHEYRQQNQSNRIDNNNYPSSWNVDPSDII